VTPEIDGQPKRIDGGKSGIARVTAGSDGKANGIAGVMAGIIFVTTGRLLRRMELTA
jgi:hypothetical protein